MTTTTTKTIGTGGDYSTLALWIAACPANLVSGDVIYQGKCKNQLFSSASNLLSIAGITTDATRYIELTTDTGASFRDNASVQSNALQWNSSNGAAIECSAAYTVAIDIPAGSNAYFKLSKLQIRTASAGNAAAAFTAQGTGTVTVDGCIFEGSSANSPPINIDTNAVVFTNNLVVNRKSGPSTIANFAGTSLTAVNNTFVVPSDLTAATNAIRLNYPASVLFQNCAFFGATNVVVNQLGSAPAGTTFTNCAGDDASPPSGVTNRAYNTTTGSGFQNITDSTRDYRIKSGSALLDVGLADTTNAPVDIAGTARPSGAV